MTQPLAALVLVVLTTLLWVAAIKYGRRPERKTICATCDNPTPAEGGVPVDYLCEECRAHQLAA